MNDMPYYLRSSLTLQNPRNKFTLYVKQKLTFAAAKCDFSPFSLARPIHHTPHDRHMREFRRAS